MRVFDVVGALALLVLTVPMLVAASAAILLSDPGPIVFRQRRVGRGGHSFSILKLRTMRVGAEAQLRRSAILHDLYIGHDFKVPATHDPRIGRVGRWLRSYSIDELPQLINVIRGEMSLVGPRPVVPEELDMYLHLDALDAYLNARPGMSGLWQVSGRSRVGRPTRVRLDEEYVRNRTFWLYLGVLARTPGAVLRRDGAY
jgi:lipopolysaccharide/colanic/teichoic acid biosynthesis glycosyltransferase